jgi:hypothetical protein
MALFYWKNVWQMFGKDMPQFYARGLFLNLFDRLQKNVWHK